MCIIMKNIVNIILYGRLIVIIIDNAPVIKNNILENGYKSAEVITSIKNK